MKKILTTMTVLTAMLATSCTSKKNVECELPETAKYYALVELNTDMSQFNDNEKQMLSHLFDAASLMNDVFWKQAYAGNKNEFLKRFETDKELTAFAEINYGPWERLDGNKPWVEGFGEKPAGAGFYPEDMTTEEFEALEDSNKTSLYTIIKRDENGKLNVVWYHDAYKAEFTKAAELLEKSAELAEDPAFKNYLQLRAKALLSSDYYESDMAWMDVKNAKFDFVIGPIENYEDALFGYKAACESFILIKDADWSQKLSKFTAMLPTLQSELPVPAEYKSEMPGTDSDMNVYEAVYYQGDCNAGSKTIAINLPNDERIHVSKGTRKLQLKNSMKAKFDKILLPISSVVINPDQVQYVKFDAFFENVTFHEVAHGMGVKTTLQTKQSLRQALKEMYSPIEEAKADIMGLYLVDELHKKGELNEGDVNENYLTFFAGIFRSVRFGAASAHGRANMMCLNFFADNGVFSRDENGIYTVDIEKMKQATRDLLAKILILQGDGDYAGAKKWVTEKSLIDPVLQADLDRIANANIPKDIYFKQGKSVLGLK
ncbi:MAG: Zn-dependent hydrolase [Bacteroidales bacterium]|jgi:hypothetical protein|nr:Zn-dependent hydrolase [Bacteroidales bacterium]